MSAGPTLLLLLALLETVVCRTVLERSKPTGRQLAQTSEASVVYYWQGTVLPARNASDGEGGGGIIFQGGSPPGDLLGVVEGLPAIEDCLLACHRLDSCNAVVYCARQAGCSSDAPRNFTAASGSCRLIYQTQSAPEVGRPILAFPAPEFTGGAPVEFTAPAVEGYTATLGVGFFTSANYGCEGSLDKSMAACVLEGGPQLHAPRCNADPSCRGMTFYPKGREYGEFPLTLLKGGPGMGPLNLSEAIFNTNSILYLRQGVEAEAGQGDGSGGGLSSGAIAGIVVGACCGLALATAGMVLLAKRAKRQPAQQEGGPEVKVSTGSGQPHTPGEGSGGEAGSSGKTKLPSSHSGERQLPTPPPSGGPPGTAPSSGSFEGLPLGRLGSISTGEAVGVRLSDPISNTSSNELLFARMEEDCASCIIPFESIHFCHDADGSYQELGSGAYSTVYRVMLDGIQPHAAKVLRVGNDPGRQQSFIREASLLRRLRHRNIVSFAGVCISPEGRGIIVMELMDGRDLHSRLLVKNKAGKRVFSWYNRGRTVALDVARGLHYLHSRNIGHFDLKGGNILLTRDLTAKLGDVGFAKSTRTTHHSLSGSHAGTFDYMAPELLMGRRTCTNAVDIYSFGIVLWEVCTGEYPSRGCLRPLRVPEECPQEVEEIFLLCTEEDPEKRPSAQALAQRLARLQH